MNIYDYLDSQTLRTAALREYRRREEKGDLVPDEITLLQPNGVQDSKGIVRIAINARPGELLRYGPQGFHVDAKRIVRQAVFRHGRALVHTWTQIVVGDEHLDGPYLTVEEFGSGSTEAYVATVMQALFVTSGIERVPDPEAGEG